MPYLDDASHCVECQLISYVTLISAIVSEYIESSDQAFGPQLQHIIKLHAPPGTTPNPELRSNIE